MSGQAPLSDDFPRRFRAAFDATYYVGGQAKGPQFEGDTGHEVQRIAIR